MRFYNGHWDRIRWEKQLLRISREWINTGQTTGTQCTALMNNMRLCVVGARLPTSHAKEVRSRRRGAETRGFEQLTIRNKRTKHTFFCAGGPRGVTKNYGQEDCSMTVNREPTTRTTVCDRAGGRWHNRNTRQKNEVFCRR